MEWLGEVAGLATSAASGGIFGLIGSGIGAVAKYFQTKANRAFEQEKWAYEERLLDRQMERDRMAHEQDVELIAQEGAWQGLDSSIAHDTMLARQSAGWVSSVKSLFRPVLTLALVGAEVFIFWNVWTGFQSEAGSSILNLLNAEQSPATNLLQYVVYSIVFAAQTAVVWWFGDRAFAPPGMKNR